MSELYSAATDTFYSLPKCRNDHHSDTKLRVVQNCRTRSASNVITNMPDQGFRKVWPWWLLRHFEKPQLFDLNTKMAINRGFNIFWREVLLYFERPFRSLKTPY